MKKLSLALFAYLLLATPAMAGNIGECGWGSKLFEGQRGIAPQAMASTTNGVVGNQTFAITSGTSGCTQNGIVRSTFQTVMYIDSNMEMLAYDTAIGEGESLENLASLLNIEAADKALFKKTMQQNFKTIFPKDSAESAEVYAGLRDVLKGSDALAHYAVQM